MSSEHLPVQHTRHRAWLSIGVVALLVSGTAAVDAGAGAPVVEIPGVPAAHSTPEAEAVFASAAERREHGREIAAEIERQEELEEIQRAAAEKAETEAEAKAAAETKAKEKAAAKKKAQADAAAEKAAAAQESDDGPSNGNSGKESASEQGSEPKDDLSSGPPRRGSTGAAVVAVQQRLQAHGWNLYADGDFGAGTDAALRQFQAAYGLSADGVAGSATMAALNQAPRARASTGSSGGSSGGSANSGGSPSSGSTSSSAPATEPAAPSAPSGGIVQQTNWYRAQAGCGPVSSNGALSAAAQGHVNDMAANGYFSHTSLDGRTFDQRIRAAGYSAPGGENLARGQTSATQVMKEWMASAGHRANIVNCSFRTIGVGQTGVYWAQEFGY
ncbi:Uncharacterized conserved protein YkwD, contains CAP (CSP/antigen 5/PR1) domain [Paraoerskovia marina]|uniref:Uncharacterized conserved protein YkwD, contains CAP (CSP/antigen 5/PR1) domain n=1 Tax=Paraoerskovia marina TaxID=545619 RepID=A0A1H1LW64_9CELL|nr:CAP domain-containing protein [Paraoerskovia marina]SDR78492.1 Uncharacterized conserved protein YkwD, contains CAP (CSP/antigen 5/PR1) domain [Paraoerskovia marina]